MRLEDMDPYQVLTRQEAAAVLHVHVRTLDRMRCRKVRRGRNGTGYLVKDIRRVADRPKND